METIIELFDSMGISNNEKNILNNIKPKFLVYSKKIIDLYIINRKKYKKEFRKFHYLIKYISNSINRKKKIIISNSFENDKRFILLIIFSFELFDKLYQIRIKSDYRDIKNLKIAKVNKLLSSILLVIVRFYTEKWVDEKKLELFLKFLIILSITSQVNLIPNKNGTIVNIMPLLECINIIKNIFKKKLEFQNEFTENEKKIIINVFNFIHDYIIGSSNQKPMNIINKSYLSLNESFTSSFFNLIILISIINDNEVNDSSIELFSNIYAFTFNSSNLKNRIMKIIQSFFKVNIKEEDNNNNINYTIPDLNKSIFLIKLLKELINKEEKLLKEDPIFLRSGLLLGDEKCSLSGEIGDLKSNFTLIFGFCLYENCNKNNKIKGWTLINIRDKKKEESQIKIWLKPTDILGQYTLLISIKDIVYKTFCIILSKKTYAFEFNFYEEFTSKKLKVHYQCEKEPIKEIDEINNIISFNDDNYNIYIGSDIDTSFFIKIMYNTFIGLMGPILILDNKKFLKLNNGKLTFTEIYNEISRLKGDKFSEFKFCDAIKAIISPINFISIEYKNIDIFTNDYNEFQTENLSIKQNFLIFDQKPNFSKNEKKIKIFPQLFYNQFHIFENKNSYDEFIKYNGVYYINLLLQYYFQNICQIEYNEIALKINIIKIVNNCIYELTQFFLKIILKKEAIKLNFKEIKNFYDLSIIILQKYISMNIINKNIVDMIKNLLKSSFEIIMEVRKEDKNNEVDNFENIKNKLIELLNNLTANYENSNDNYEKIEYYLDVMTELLTQKYFDNDPYLFKLLDKLLLLSFLFDDTNPLFKNNKSISSNLQRKYSVLLFIFFKFPSLKSKNNLIFNDNNNEKIDHLVIFDFLIYYLESIIKTINSPNIFINLIKVVNQSELLEKLPLTHFEKIQNILNKNIWKISQSKSSYLVYNSYLNILLYSYYLDPEEKEASLNNFIKTFPFNKDFFKVIIFSLKYIKYIANDNNDNLIKNELDASFFNICKDNISNIGSSYLWELDLSNLNDIQNKILINLIETCISFFFIQETTKINKNITENDSKEIYDILKANFDHSLKFIGKNVFIDLFSSDRNIASHLFYFKWKLSKDENKSLIINDLKNYNKILLKSHNFPFIFKFILLINSELKVELIIIDLLNFIYEELENNYKNYIPKNKNEIDDFFVSNIINLLVLINKLFIKNKNLILFVNESFVDLFFKIINILEKTGLFYSNYCFEIEENCGKIISEICYDLLIYLLNNSYNIEISEKFKDIFIKENKKNKVYCSIFYLIDLIKEDILEKEKNTKKELLKFINYPTLMYIHKNIFSKSLKYIFGKKINQINNINFTLYFIAKTFLYLQQEISEKLSRMFLDFFLPILIENMYRLWTKQNSFYGYRTCKRFMLYTYAKEFFEEDGIRHPNDLSIYKRFFEFEIHLKLQGKDKLENCFASRLLDRKPNYENNSQITEVKPKPEAKKDKGPEFNINIYQKEKIIIKDYLKEEKVINKNEKNDKSKTNSFIKEENKVQNSNKKSRTKSFMIEEKKENIMIKEKNSNKNLLKIEKSLDKKSVKKVKKKSKEEKPANIKPIKEQKNENKNVLMEKKDEKISGKTNIKEDKNDKQININPVIEPKTLAMDKSIIKDEKVQVQNNDKIKEHDELMEKYFENDNFDSYKFWNF